MPLALHPGDLREQDLTRGEDALLRRLGRLTKAGAVNEFTCYWDARSKQLVCKPVLTLRADDGPGEDPLTALRAAS